jgi:hypothetical protein
MSKKIEKNCVICKKLKFEITTTRIKNSKEKIKKETKEYGGQILLLTQRLSNIG